jgi:hypothetical protein
MPNHIQQMYRYLLYGGWEVLGQKNEDGKIVIIIWCKDSWEFPREIVLGYKYE